MSESARLLKGIMKTSGWTQEQVAMKLRVSYPTMNAWVNGKSKPRQAMMDKIRRLYLAQDITDDVEPTYVTLVNVPRWLKVGDMLILEKDYDNSYDDEAISAVIMETDEEWDDNNDEWREDDNAASGKASLVNSDNDGIDEAGRAEAGDSRIGRGDDLEDNEDDEIFGGRVAPIAVDSLRIEDCPEVDYMYVANSINTVVRGTSSAGRIYDKFEKAARARVLFVFHKTAIARVVEWNYAKEGE